MRASNIKRRKLVIR